MSNLSEFIKTTKMDAQGSLINQTWNVLAGREGWNVNTNQVVVVDLNDTGSEVYEDFSQLESVHTIFVVLYLLICLLSFVGNLMVLQAIVSNASMQTIVNYYIFNLALCDLLISVFVLPSKMIELLTAGDWLWLNEHVCIVLYVLQSVIVFANLLTLVAICFERYANKQNCVWCDYYYYYYS